MTDCVRPGFPRVTPIGLIVRTGACRVNDQYEDADARAERLDPTVEAHESSPVFQIPVDDSSVTPLAPALTPPQSHR